MEEERRLGIGDVQKERIILEKERNELAREKEQIRRERDAIDQNKRIGAESQAREAALVNRLQVKNIMNNQNLKSKNVTTLNL